MTRAGTARLARRCRAALLLALPARAGAPALGPRLEYKHPAGGHEVHVSGAAVAAGADGRPVVAWAAQEGQRTRLFVAPPAPRASPRAGRTRRRSASEALHQPPAARDRAGRGTSYVTWSSRSPSPRAPCSPPTCACRARSTAADVRGAPARERGPPDLALLRRARGGRRRHRARGLDRRPRGAPDAGHLARPRGRAGDRASSASARSATIRACAAGSTRPSGPATGGAVRGARSFPATSATWCWPARRRRAYLRRSGAGAADRWKINACPHRGRRGGWDGAAALRELVHRGTGTSGPTCASRSRPMAGASVPPRRLHTSATLRSRQRAHGGGPRRPRGRRVGGSPRSAGASCYATPSTRAGPWARSSPVEAIKAWTPDVAVARDGCSWSPGTRSNSRHQDDLALRERQGGGGTMTNVGSGGRRAERGHARGRYPRAGPASARHAGRQAASGRRRGPSA